MSPDQRGLTDSQSIPIVKVVVAGDGRVGKTSLIRRHSAGMFQASRVMTIGVDFQTIVVKLDNRSVKLSIWDIAGQDRFDVLSTRQRPAAGRSQSGDARQQLGRRLRCRSAGPFAHRGLKVLRQTDASGAEAPVDFWLLAARLERNQSRCVLAIVCKVAAP